MLSLKQRAKALPLKRAYGQNFLVDAAVLDAIVAAALPPTSSSPHLIEIGCGAGFLTERLLAIGATLTGFEIDPAMIACLQPLVQQAGQRFDLRHQSILDADLLALMPEQQRTPIVGNLPYHLTGPILKQLCGPMGDTTYALRPRTDQLILMVQREVAQRLMARPGTKAYGQLTLQIQCWYEVTSVIDVPAGCFFPPPKVDSTVIALTPRPKAAVNAHNYQALSQLVKGAFQHRRKTLCNSLKASRPDIETGRVQATLDQLGLAGNVRAEVLSLAQFAQLSDALEQAPLP